MDTADPILCNTSTAEPLVSVIVPTFNRPRMLKDTLASIEAQSYKRIEIVIVNDGGVDAAPILRGLRFKHQIVYLLHATNKGLAAARNTGLRAATGEYIAYVDDDDIYYPDHIETLVSFLLQSKYKVAYTDAYQADQRRRRSYFDNLLISRGQVMWEKIFCSWLTAAGTGASLQQLYCDQPFMKLNASSVDLFSRCGGKYLIIGRTVKYSEEFDRDTLLVRNFVPILCLMHHRSCLDQAGLFDETLTSHEDWDLWIRMSREHIFSHIKKLTCEYTQRSDGSNMSMYRKADFKRTMKIIHERYSHLTVNASLIEAQKAFLLRAFS